MQLFRESRIRVCSLPLALSFVSVLLIAGLPAQEPDSQMDFMGQMTASMTEMDAAMKAAPMNGDHDHDFAAMMIPHHQAAIDMAKAELLYGKDPAMRRLAEEIIVDQNSEIEVMNLWLRKRAEAQRKAWKR